jgi:hypothetical protein
MDELVTIQLPFAQALVLSGCLDRLNRTEQFAPFIDSAEQWALWYLDNTLEAWNPVIFSDDYDRYVQEAKSHITRGTDE